MKDEVEQIAAMNDPVIRNLRITECYSRLAAAMPPGSANWCTFATWASRQAGRTIRGEDLLYRLQGELRRDAELLHPIQLAVALAAAPRAPAREHVVRRSCTRRSTPSSWRATPSRAGT